VLVLGGTGLIGSRVVTRLLKAGIPVTTLSRRGYLGGDPAPSQLRVVTGDVSDAAVLGDAIRDADQVVYAVSSGTPQIPSSTPLADMERAIGPLLVVLEAMRIGSGMRLFFLSSGGAVYGNPTSLPVTEDAPTAPISPYGVWKLAAEKYIAMYGHVYGIQYCIVRAGNVYGDGQVIRHGHGAVATVLQAAETSRAVHVLGNGDDLRDYVFADDLAHVLVELVTRSNLPQVINVGTGQGTSIRQLIAIIEQVTGTTIRAGHVPPRPFDVGSIVLDSNRLSTLVEWLPTPLQVGIAGIWKRLQGKEARALGEALN
jgi:UDP-glucose 4-epimerase